MSKYIQNGAVQADADLCNVIEPPVQGCHAGAGIHVVIPIDYATRILAGQSMPGCTYHALQLSAPAVLDALTVSNFTAGRLGVPAIVNALLPQQKAQAVLLNAKLASAVNV